MVISDVVLGSREFTEVSTLDVKRKKEKEKPFPTLSVRGIYANRGE
jgi:hypothetical protein